MNNLVAIILLSVTILFLAIFLIHARKSVRYFKRALDMKCQRHDTTIQTKISLSKKQLETAFDAITDYICALDKNLVIMRLNRSYAAFVKMAIADVLGRHCYEVFWKRTTPCDHCPALSTFTDAKPVMKQSFRMSAQDRMHYFAITSYPVFNSAGEVENVIEHIRDSTEEKALLEQLIRSEKLATIGTMTAGIAHELINPLSGISGTAVNMLQMPDKYGLNEKGTARMSTILDAVSRASAIVKDLLHLSRKETGTSVLTDINSMVFKSVEAVRLKGLSSVNCTISADDSLKHTFCDPVKIEQVVINLLTNAIQSTIEKATEMQRKQLPYSGTIFVSTRNDQNTVCIDITDNGIGIGEEIRGKIFDPFFTTKPPGEGTGLGLSICQKIIEEHHGKIVVDSTDSHTTFSVQLPV